MPSPSSRRPARPCFHSDGRRRRGARAAASTAGARLRRRLPASGSGRRPVAPNIVEQSVWVGGHAGAPWRCAMGVWVADAYLIVARATPE
eukprot:scaffold2661_cov120-Isochrysis_galbana.AAC.7